MVYMYMHVYQIHVIYDNVYTYMCTVYTPYSVNIHFVVAGSLHVHVQVSAYTVYTNAGTFVGCCLETKVFIGYLRGVGDHRIG